jgi:hypothetical protein
VVLWDLPAYPERFAARLVASGAMPSPYLLLGDSLAGIRDHLPPGLVRSERMPVDPPEVVEFGSRSSGRITPSQICMFRITKIVASHIIKI